MKIPVLIFTIFLFISNITFCQTKNKFNPTGTVNDQFESLINSSNKYQDYKVIKLNSLLKLKGNINDSLVASKKEILSSANTINSQLKTIDSLNISLADSKNEITTLNSKIESISLLGIQVEKDLFKTIMFSIIGVLILLLALFISKFKSSNTVTKQSQKDFKELEVEYDDHRRKALEREQKAMRKLQDELNKQKKD
ncbi:coiled-coil domain-containing protein [Lutibacter citreus]|uniref:coiled-coil domain-containing protein n=1 Tax=Lutibacter citreus TaxID=2138210 RepID=UPI000DBE832A|nr:hypothetical protein [Lutibacter citreus]